VLLSVSMPRCYNTIQHTFIIPGTIQHGS